MKRLAVFALVLASTLASCSRTDNGYQGWIEANLIFVAPDEVGRVQTLAVREGDSIKAGQPLFTVDDDLQQVDLAQVKASLANAQQTFDRAQQLAKTGSGTQKDLDAATMVLRDAQARLNSAQTRLARRQVFSPVTGTVQEVYYRPGEVVPAGRPVVSLLPPGNIKVRFFVPEPVLASIDYGDVVKVSCDSCSPTSPLASALLPDNRNSRLQSSIASRNAPSWSSSSRPYPSSLTRCASASRSM